MLRTSRRVVLASGAAAMLGLNRAAAAPSPGLADLHKAAQKEGTLTWYAVPMTTSSAERVAKAFTKTYPGVEVNVVRTTAQVAYQRVLQEIQANSVQCDVITSTVVAQYLQLKTDGELLQYTPGSAATMIDVPYVRKLDPDGTYFASVVYLTTLFDNTAKVKPDEAPAAWSDLTKPAWKSQIALAHPGFSGTAGVWAVAMQKMYGDDFFRQMEKNKPTISRSIIDAMTSVASGGSKIGVGGDYNARQSAAGGNPIAIVYPSDGSIPSISPSAILKKSPHPNAAKLFMEFLLSADMSRVMTEEYYQSLHEAVPSRPGIKKLTEIKTVLPSDDEMTDKLPGVIRMWRDVFGV